MLRLPLRARFGFTRSAAPAWRQRARLEVESLEDRLVPAAVSSSPTQNFVDQVYRDVFNRPADAAALSFWSAQLDQGMTRLQVSLGILTSNEGLSLEVNSLFARFLDRPTDAVGLRWGMGVLQNGGTVAQLETALLSSPEYFAKNGSNFDTFLTDVYEDLFVRTVDAEGRAGWDQVFASGVSPATVASMLVDSPETRNVEVTADYKQFLQQRKPEADALAFFTNVLQQQGSLVVQADILASAEYFANAQSPVPAANTGTAAVTVTTTPALPAAVTVPYTFTATVRDNKGGQTPTGTVQFLVDSKALGAAILLVNGKATSPATILSPDNHTITAVYSGDANFPGTSLGKTTLTFQDFDDLTTLDTDETGTEAPSPLDKFV